MKAFLVWFKRMWTGKCDICNSDLKEDWLTNGDLFCPRCDSIGTRHLN